MPESIYKNAYYYCGACRLIDKFIKFVIHIKLNFTCRRIQV